MNSEVCFLYGAGEYYNFTPLTPDDTDFVIAVDGGYNYIKQTGIHTSLLIGDFDSVNSRNDISGYTGDILEYPPKKDYTDMQLAINEGIRRGYSSFIIYGALGGRFDHSIANIQLLANLSAKGLHVYLIGNRQIITGITNSSLIGSAISTGNRCQDMLAPICGNYISVFAHSDICEGVTLSGLAYNTDHITLNNTYPLGTSNEFTANDYTISVEHGTLIIVAER